MHVKTHVTTDRCIGPYSSLDCAVDIYSLFVYIYLGMCLNPACPDNCAECSEILTGDDAGNTRCDVCRSGYKKSDADDRLCLGKSFIDSYLYGPGFYRDTMLN